MYPGTRTQWLGTVAGTASGLLLVGVLFVGRFRLLALGGDGVVGLAPLATVDNPADPALAAVWAGTLLVGLVAGLVDGLYTDAGDVSWVGLASAVAYAPLVLGVVAAVAFAGRLAVQEAAAGAVDVAVVGALVALLVLVPAGLVAGVVGAFVVVVPAVAGAYVGSCIGRAAGPESGD